MSPRKSATAKLSGADAQPTAEKPEFEQRADREAAALLMPPEVIDKFIARHDPLYSKKKILLFANRINIHPGIIVGQLQRYGKLPGNHYRELLVMAVSQNNLDQLPLTSRA